LKTSSRTSYSPKAFCGKETAESLGQGNATAQRVPSTASVFGSLAPNCVAQDTGKQPGNICERFALCHTPEPWFVCDVGVKAKPPTKEQ
jgi:hypothetical protein